MPRYLIEREVGGVGASSAEQLQQIAQTSCNVLREMGSSIQWQHSFITDHKIYCLYIAPDERAVREHATRGGFPANRVSEIVTVIDPATAE